MCFQINKIILRYLSRSGSKVMDRSRICQGTSDIASDLREAPESSADEK